MDQARTTSTKLLGHRRVFFELRVSSLHDWLHLRTHWPRFYFG